ncbi:MAG: radical SAM protein [Oscillospiraceae bacterium]|jgi:formate C-acetyltransferase|nr:radical SAM protein [Oscillospiraceae bacterium]
MSVAVIRKTSRTDTSADTHTIAKIQRTCVHDGTGLRTTVFFKGCGLRCLWCQNPENLTAEPRAEDLHLTTAELVQILKKDAKYYKATGGGVTLSGGEPLLQKKDFLLELLTALKAEGIHTAVETTLHAPWETIEAAAPLVDLFLVDFKVCGDIALHEKLTGQADTRIRENAKKLTDLRGTEGIRIRMVVVPGCNDSEAQLHDAAEYVRFLGFDTIELLQYWTFYEEKAEKFGIKIPQLGIPQKKALSALQTAAAYLRGTGLNVWSDSLQPPPYHAQFTDRVKRIRQELWEAPREICFETSFLKTDYYKKGKGFSKPVPIHRSERLKYVLGKRTIHVYDGELLVGNFTAKRVAGQIWEEQYGALYVTFLYKAARQTPVSFFSTKEERSRFYRDVLPYWLPKCIVGKFLGANGIKGALQTFSSVAEQKVGFLNNFAAIAHFVPNYERILENGTTGLKRECLRLMKEHPENNTDFYKGVYIGLDALELFGARYAEELKRLARDCTDSVRKAELEQMAETCARVPKYPARTFREALQAITFLQIALCTEAYENAVSFGRFDQLLNPYYERDVAAGIIDYEGAKELLALFVLKMDECILVNDGDSLLNIGKLFETLSTDQSMTFGGDKPDGTDGTNDITYMLCDICELTPLAVNMCGRVSPNSPQKYLDRLAQLYVGGCPMPELFSDKEYFDALKRHYHESDANCRDWPVIGCVEPFASHEHFGNTDSANMNVTLPLLQAMKGQEKDLWNFGLVEQLEKFVTRVLEFSFYNNKENGIRTWRENHDAWHDKLRGLTNVNPAASMEQLERRYQARLTHLAQSILADQQKLEAMLQKDFQTPLASCLYESCMERGKDTYEGGADYNSAGIQAVGITDAAESFYVIEKLVFEQQKYTMAELIEAVDSNFAGGKNEQIRSDILALPRFGDDMDDRVNYWVTRVMQMYNIALAQCPFTVRRRALPDARDRRVLPCYAEDFTGDIYDTPAGKSVNPPNACFTAGYYALNTSDRYGKYSGALPSGRRKGLSLANSVMPDHGASYDDLLSALNDVAKINFADFAVNGTTLTLTIDAALFPGEAGVRNLSEIFKTYLTTGGMQIQPNVVSRELLLEAYEHPEKHPYLMVRVAGYCAYFQELSDELKKIIIARTCYN